MLDATGKRIVWIGSVWPEPSASAAGLRAMQLLDALRSTGAAVTVMATAAAGDAAQMLLARGFEAARTQPNDPTFDEALRMIDPEIVVFDRFMIEEQFSWRVRQCCPNATRILDTIDLHHLRAERERIARNDSAITEASVAPDALREVASLYRSHRSIVVSDDEKRLLEQRYGIPETLVSVAPPWFSPRSANPPFHERRHCVFIGNYLHDPNVDAVEVLARTVWPALRARLGDDVELHLYGSYETHRVRSLENRKGGIVFCGHAEDAIATLAKYRIQLAPLRFGAGIKGKIADAWCAGTPSVTTSIGAEAMRSKSGDFGGVVANDWESFSEEARLLYLDIDRWLASQRVGLVILGERFRESANKDTLLRAICSPLSGGEPVFSQVFRELLWHQQFRATEYMSRWIEAKNARG